MTQNAAGDDAQAAAGQTDDEFARIQAAIRECNERRFDASLAALRDQPGVAGSPAYAAVIEAIDVLGLRLNLLDLTIAKISENMLAAARAIERLAAEREAEDDKWWLRSGEQED